MTITEINEQIAKEQNFQASLADMKREDMVEKARAWSLKVNGGAPSKNNRVGDLRAALLAHSNFNLNDLNIERARLEAEAAAAAAATQEQESEEQEQEEDSALIVGREIVVDVINPVRGYHRLEVPYILKVVAESGPEAINIYLWNDRGEKAELIGTAASIKAARQKVGRHAGPWTLPAGYEVRKEDINGVEYMTAYFEGSALVRGNGKKVSFPTAKSNSTRPRCELAIYQHSQGLLK